MNGPAVTIAVVSWNTRELLDACLRSLRADSEQGLAAVWVVDNGSSDGSVELVREQHPWATLLQLDNVGYGRAVNAVAARTSSPWVIASNADTEVLPGALAALLAAGERHPRAGLIGPRLILPDGETQLSSHHFPGLRATLREAPLIRHLRPQPQWDPSRGAVVEWLPGAFMFVRRGAWEQTGGFDEEQWMYAEDLDLCWRMAQAGWEVRYEPAAQVRHELSAATRKAFGAKLDARWQAASWTWMARRRGLALTRATAAVELAIALARVTRCLVLPWRLADARGRARLALEWSYLRAAALGLRPRRRLLARR